MNGCAEKLPGQPRGSTFYGKRTFSATSSSGSCVCFSSRYEDIVNDKLVVCIKSYMMHMQSCPMHHDDALPSPPSKPPFKIQRLFVQEYELFQGGEDVTDRYCYYLTLLSVSIYSNAMRPQSTSVNKENASASLAFARFLHFLFAPSSRASPHACTHSRDS